MTETAFIGRERELSLLDRLWQTPKATFLILYGRRRVGKTRLLTHWLRSHSTDVLYWMAEPTSALDQLRSFSQALVNFIDPETPASPDFSYDTWEHAFRQVSLLAKERRIALLIDEVTYIMDVNPNIVGALQKSWDHWLSDSNLMLALCGSQMGLMQRHLLDYQAPLYGRATAQLRLAPLSFGVTGRFFRGYSASERVQVYSMWGGVPAYWERLNTNIPVLENLSEQLVPSNTWMLDESRLLLQDFINDPYNYVGVMRAIADGNQSLSAISKRIGLSSGPTSKYLSILRDTGFVVRRVPATKQGTSSRQGRYFVTDPYLRFYYRFLAAYQSQLALGKQEQTLRTIAEGLPAFIQTNTWQELCREWMLMASNYSKLPLQIEHADGEWKRTYTIDLVGIHEKEKNLVMASCYWDKPPAAKDAITELVKRTSAIVPDDEKWNVYYLLFSAKSWPKAAQQQAEDIVSASKTGRATRKRLPVGVKLLDLEEVDSDLVHWSASPN